MFRSIKSSLLIAVGVIATTHIAVASTAGGRVEVGRVMVSYGDLNLSDVSDARTMLSRLHQAAYRACGGDARWDPSYKLLWGTLEANYRECRSDAVSRAIATVDAPLLSQMFQGADERLVGDAGPTRR